MRALLSTIIYVFLLLFTKERFFLRGGGELGTTVLLPRMKLKCMSKMNTFEIKCLKTVEKNFH